MTSRASLYLDHHATTPVDERVLDAMLPYFRDDFGNPASSSHAYGWRAEAAVDDARERIAGLIGVEPEEVVFTSGATESNNLAIQGIVRGRGRGPSHLVSVETEHPSVLETFRMLEREGHTLDLLSVDDEGSVTPEGVIRAMRDETTLVSVMAANSEIGVIQPVVEIARACRERGAVFHCDAAQAMGKVPIDFAELDLVSFSGHKIYGPKGVGVLIVRNRRPRLRIRPLFAGGGQERELRPGTLPVPLIVGIARALELCVEEREAEAARQRALRDRLREGITSQLDGVLLNGPVEPRLPANLNLSFEGVDGERLLLALTDLGVSSGSACSSASTKPSHVLLALGRSPDLARASLRFGLGRSTSAADVQTAVERVVETVKSLRG